MKYIDSNRYKAYHKNITLINLDITIKFLKETI